VLHESLAEETNLKIQLNYCVNWGITAQIRDSRRYSVEHEAEVVLSGLGFKTGDFNRRLSEFSADG